MLVWGTSERFNNFIHVGHSSNIWRSRPRLSKCSAWRINGVLCLLNLAGKCPEPETFLAFQVENRLTFSNQMQAESLEVIGLSGHVDYMDTNH